MYKEIHVRIQQSDPQNDQFLLVWRAHLTSLEYGVNQT